MRVGVRPSGLALLVLWGILLVLQTLRAGNAAENAFSEDQLDFFERQVRPLLVNRCYSCHSGQTDEPKGGLRVDSRQALLAGGDTGPALVPGDLAASLLADAVSYEGVYQMPPSSKLPDQEIAILRRWVEMGGPWTPEEVVQTHRRSEFDLAARRAEHWCWQPVADPPLPRVVRGDWPQQPLDHFILAALEEAGLSPSPPADRAALIRRAYFDLLGLPPAPEEVRRFLADDDPQAFARLVDRLLESTHFGERWARHFMDLMRYAETYGHEFDYAIPHAAQYRNYLIRAFNADVPYDQLVLEHLAGDLLPQPRRHPVEGYNESIIGTGAWWLGEATHAPVDVLGDAANRVDNQLDVVTKSFLALTVACARCHDHKFDAISTRDYYALAGALLSSRRQEAFLDPGGNSARQAAALRQVQQRGTQQLRTSLVAGQRLDGHTFAANLLAASVNGTATAGGPAPSAETIELWKAALADPQTQEATHPMHAWTAACQPTANMPQVVEELRQELHQHAVRVEQQNAALPLLADFDRFPPGWFVTGEAFSEGTGEAGWDWSSETPQWRGAGMADSGRHGNRLQGVLRSPTFTLKHSKLFYKLRGTGTQVRLVLDGYFMDTFSALLFRGCTFDVDTQGATVWHEQAQDVGRYVGHRAYLEVIDHGDGYIALDEIRFSDGPRPQDTPSRVARAVLDALPAPSNVVELAAAYGHQWEKALSAMDAGAATAEQVEWINWALRYGLLGTGAADALREPGAAWEQAHAAVPQPRRVLAMADGTGEDAPVYIRGNHRTPGDAVPRQLLEALRTDMAPVAQGSGRLVIARQIVEPTNPLTARVMVNRLWHHLFGRGIVPSVDNFGVLGEAPTHPELLDHLAQRFISQRWSIKRMLREMMLSSTYQMSSRPDPNAAALDPQNRLFHYMPLRRLQGEPLRDAMLSVAGTLNPAPLEGSVPAHLTPFMQGRGRPKTEGPLDGDCRRSLYLEVRRNFLSPFMLAFDVPIPFSTMGKRNVSNVPAQALILMNDPFVVQQANRWAEQVLAAGGTFDEQLDRMYLAAFARFPRSDEREAARQFLESQARQRGVASEQALQDLHGWADLGHVLWNTKEFTFLR